jgi:hypothetical protein
MLTYVEYVQGGACVKLVLQIGCGILLASGVLLAGVIALFAACVWAVSEGVDSIVATWTAEAAEYDATRAALDASRTPTP